MNKLFAIYKKELKSYFLSPIAYVSIGFYLALSGIFFYITTIGSQIASMDYAFSNMMFVILLISPIISMRLIAEEKKSGTDQLLLTSPIKPFSIIWGKYLAAVSIYAVMLVITLIYPMILYHYANIDLGPVFTGYLGLFLVGSAFISSGVFASALTENQIIAGLASVAILFSFILVEWIAGRFQGVVNKVLVFLTIMNHFDNFQAGIIDSVDTLYYLSFIFIFLYLTGHVLARKWSRG